MGGLILLSILIIGAFLFSFIGVIVLLARTKRQEENIIDLRRKLNEFYKEKTHTEESIVVTELTPEEPTTSSEVITANETILPCETKLANQTTPSNEAIIVNEIVSPDETISPDLTSISVPALDIPSQKNEKKVYNAILSFIKGGNFWAVGGVLLLIAGFGLLIAYLGRRGFFTVEMGIAAAAAAGLAMILFGWRLRKKRPLYFLILQGGGIGILYLSVFAAHRLTSHFGIILSLVLMSLLIPPVIIMALFQNSEGLALLGFLGGFAAPLLLSSGNGNHLFLFSYYLVLNGGVLTIGFFRRWKGLNLLAFFLTFIPVIYWAMYKYSPALFPASQPFFVAFFLIFTILGIRNLIYKDNELKQKNKTSYSDIIVVLGTPIAAAVLQWKVFSFIEHGYAIVAVIFSAFYLGLSVFILKKAKQAMRIYAEGYLALGTLLANLVIPLELSPGLSGALWAAEGSFIFFLGLRASPWPINEKRKERGDIRIMAAGIIIHIAAAIAFIKNITIFHLEEPLPYRSPVFSGSLIIAISAIIISILAEKLSGKNKRNAITICAGIWGFAFWFTGWLYEFARVLPNPLNAFLILASLTAIVSWASAAVFNLKFLLIGMAPLSLAGFIMVLKVYFNQLSFHYTYNSYNLIFTHNFFDSLNYKGTLAFLLSQSLTILFLRPKKNTNSSLHISGDKKILQTAEAPWFRDTRIFLAIVTALAVFSSSGRFFSYKLELSPSWASLAGLSPVFAALIIYPFINFRQSQKGTSPNEPSVRRFGGAFQKINILEILPIVLSGILGLWFLVTLFLPGNPSPLPFYIPILNPIDLLEGLCITVILFWQIKSQKENDTGKKKIIMSRTALFVLGDILTFLWIISILARSLHFFAGIRWDEVASSGGFQLCLFVFWALYGILHIVLGHKKKKRIPWIAGAILVAIDIIKLILFDMRDINTVPRILSFFAAGLVLLFIGWAAPLPPPHLSTKEKVNEEK